MGIYKNYYSNFRGAIIPHAGQEYAGAARKLIFNNLNDKNKNTEYIIYLAALHNPINSSDKVFILDYDNDIDFNMFLNNNDYIKDQYLSKGAKEEHSYKWVKSEIKDNFKNSKILVLCPTPYSNLKKLANEIINFIYKINNKNKTAILFATTDLTHYGKRFNNISLLKFPQELNKWRREEKLIDNLLKNNLENEDLNIICAPYAIRTYIYISSYFNWNARVIDYYDSNNYNKNLIDKYRIHFDYNIEFVSYISIIYGTFKDDNNLLPIDIIMALGVVKSTIESQLLKYDIEIKLPIWNKFNYMNNGIFIGTENDNSTNSCYGNFQTDKNNINSSLKIINSAKKCLNDSINRWDNPITKNNLNNHIFKIEILDDINSWKEHNSMYANEKFILDGNHGMLLKLYNGNTATFLPIVSEDNKESWSINNYMTHLSIKAGGHKNDWKHKDSIMNIYSSITLKYSPINNTIIAK
jgi:AmmeMemoRadiSam system protein B